MLASFNRRFGELGIFQVWSLSNYTVWNEKLGQLHYKLRNQSNRKKTEIRKKCQTEVEKTHSNLDKHVN